MLESVKRLRLHIRNPVAFARLVLYSTRLDSLLGVNEFAHSFEPITTDQVFIVAYFGATIIRSSRPPTAPLSSKSGLRFGAWAP